MSKFSDFLAALGVAPKTLPQANETLTAAKMQLDSVTALFTAAGLNLEQLLAAGPDALKAHLASLDNTAEVTRLTGELAAATAAITSAESTLKLRDSTLAAFAEQFKAIGLADITNTTPAADVKSKFEAHVAKATTLALAKTGHPPAHVPATETPATATKSDADLAAEYEKLPRGQAKADFYAKHEQALWRHDKAQKNKPE